MNRAVVPLVPKRASKKKKKEKMSVGESFAFLLKSRYIRDLATLVTIINISKYIIYAYFFYNFFSGHCIWY